LIFAIAFFGVAVGSGSPGQELVMVQYISLVKELRQVEISAATYRDLFWIVSPKVSDINL
jgi:hypothetical protein